MKYVSYKEIPDISELLAIKHNRGISISLALPAKNEEATIGRVIECAQSCQPLVDEIKIFDSGSEDNTLQVCSRYNIEVVRDQETVAILSTPLSRGKGWNLWSSIYYTSGDIIVWIDTDIENIHPRFILGVIFPLLTDPKIVFSKGYYKRPKGDARVTEILVRPFLNMLFPEAADFIQPLSGEYGGTRTFLESATFFSGYSIEVALLLQAIIDHGPEKVAQVFLDQRVHPLQDVPSLGKMAASILHTLLQLASKYRRLIINCDVKQWMKIFHAITGDPDEISSEIVHIADTPLPRMIDISSYQSRRK